MIKVQGLTKSHLAQQSRITILKNIDLHIGQRELVAIMGPSGSGKSTLMNMLGLLDRPSTGYYWLNGYFVNNLSRADCARLRNREIGFIFQSFYLLHHLTGLENIKLPLYYRGLTRDLDELALPLMEQVGVAHLAHQRPSAMSGGEQQRIAIARALIGEPNLILADEPTGALDSQTSAEVLALLKNFHAKQDKAVVIVTHDPEVAQQCQRVVKIRDGQIEVDQANDVESVS